GGDAGEFVRRSIGQMARPHQVSAVLQMPSGEAEAELRWLSVQIEDHPDPSRRDRECRATFRAPDLQWLASNVVGAAMITALELEPPAGGTGPGSAADVEAVRTHLSTLRGRLKAAVG